MFSYEIIRNFNNLEIAIYNYIISNSHDVIKMTIRELANELHVSTTTILRFCSKLNCEGYSEFKYKFKDYINNKDKIKLDTDVSAIYDFLDKAQNPGIQKEIENAAKMICSRPKKIFIGIGTSGTLGKYGARYCSNLGINSLYLDDPFYPTEGGDYDDTVVIALSVSGEQRTLYKQILGFKNGNAKIVSITNTKQCTLAGISDVNIAYYMPMKVLPGLYNVTSQVPVMYILETLAHTIQAIKAKSI